jgi:hypothetical protein
LQAAEKLSSIGAKWISGAKAVLVAKQREEEKDAHFTQVLHLSGLTRLRY